VSSRHGRLPGGRHFGYCLLHRRAYALTPWQLLPHRTSPSAARPHTPSACLTTSHHTTTRHACPPRYSCSTRDAGQAFAGRALGRTVGDCAGGRRLQPFCATTFGHAPGTGRKDLKRTGSGPHARTPLHWFPAPPLSCSDVGAPVPHTTSPTTLCFSYPTRHFLCAVEQPSPVLHAGVWRHATPAPPPCISVARTVGHILSAGISFARPRWIHSIVQDGVGATYRARYTHPTPGTAAHHHRRRFVRLTCLPCHPARDYTPASFHLPLPPPPHHRFASIMTRPGRWVAGRPAAAPYLASVAARTATVRTICQGTRMFRGDGFTTVATVALSLPSSGVCGTYTAAYRNAGA